MGRISYSLYLVHSPIGNRVLNLASRYAPGSRAWCVGWFLAACALNVLAAEVLNRFVEAPSMRLARRMTMSPVFRGREAPRTAVVASGR
jgi:peptidoglycan/LPS O-acetylase OafA/YrhL